jgi:hypothetical protein
LPVINISAPKIAFPMHTLRFLRHPAIAFVLLVATAGTAAETLWESYDTDPYERGWTRMGSDNSFDFILPGYVLARLYVTTEDQRFTVPLAASHTGDQPFWLEFDWRFESVYEWPRGFFAVYNSASDNLTNVAGVNFQRRNISTAQESQRGRVMTSTGADINFTASYYPRPSGTVIDARTRLYYHQNLAGEGWIDLTITDLASGLVIASGSGKVMNAGGDFSYDSVGFGNFTSGTPSPQYFDRVRVDNIYFSTEQSGDEYFALQGEGRPAPSWIGDTSPPQPDPPVWEVAPEAPAASRVTMRAGVAIDDLYDVQYYFENVDNPASNSGWTTARDWTEYLLQPQTQYNYRFKTRDLSPNRNESQWSFIASVTTPVETDTNPPLPDPPEWASEPGVLGSNRILMEAAPVVDPEGNGPVQYYFANLTDPSLDSGWQVSPNFENDRLPYNTSYTYRFQARDGSGNRNETGWSSVVTTTTGDPPLFEDLIRAEGTWQATGTGETALYTVYYFAEASEERAPVIIYILNAAMPRIGTEADASIMSDFIQDGYLLITLDFNGNPLAKHPVLDTNVDLFRRAVIGYQTDPLLQGTSLLPHDENIYIVPSGWRLERDLTYWEADKHGAHGTLNRILSTYNGYVASNFGVIQVTDPADMRGPDGELIDYALRLDIVYPSQPEQPVPLLFDSATQSNRPRAFRPATGRIQHIGAVLNGMAWGSVDHCWNPLARHYHYGYWDGGYTLEDWNGLASITAAIRFFKKNAQQFGVDPDRIGGMGHSKGSYTITRLADPDHANQSEHFSFSGYPAGSPEPQPWQGFTSTIRASYQSAGNGTRRTQYVTAANVPTMVACGRFDQYNQWLVFPDLVATYEGFDLNHFAFWMTDLDHALPRNHDPIYDRDRYELFFHFFRQHLRPGSVAPELLFILPREGYGELDVYGQNRYIPSDELLVAGKEHMTERGGPVALLFAPAVDPDSANSGGLEVVRVRDGFVVPGTWVGSRGDARLSFIPDPILPDHEELEVRVNSSLLSQEGVPYAGESAYPLWTGSLSSGFDDWIDAHPEIPEGKTGALDTPAGGNISNLLSYALDLHPLRPVADEVLSHSLTGDSLVLEFPWFRDDLAYAVQYSHDLLHWWSAELTGAPELGEGWMRGNGTLDSESPRVFLRLAVEPLR